jgi:hypothetical protein
MLDFRELAAALALELDVGGDGRLEVTARAGAPEPVRPIPIRLGATTVRWSPR